MGNVCLYCSVETQSLISSGCKLPVLTSCASSLLLWKHGWRQAEIKRWTVSGVGVREPWSYSRVSAELCSGFEVEGHVGPPTLWICICHHCQMSQRWEHSASSFSVTLQKQCQQTCPSQSTTQQSPGRPLIKSASAWSLEAAWTEITESPSAQTRPVCKDWGHRWSSLTHWASAGSFLEHWPTQPKDKASLTPHPTRHMEM